MFVFGLSYKEYTFWYMAYIYIEEPKIARVLFSHTRIAWLWTIIRVYVGWQWFEAGWSKLHSAVWVGDQSGTALAGFVQGALQKTAGAHPDVQGWYASFLKQVVLAHPQAFAHLVTYGEILVGVALMVGALVGIAAFFGLFMNLNFLLAGTVSTNPVLFVLSIMLVLGWKVAGFYGLDRWLLPKLGTPWQSKIVIQKEATTAIG